MARPIKKGIDYFPMDVSFLDDMKIRKIKKACGDTGITMLIYLLSNIYKDEGYFMMWDDDVRFLVADDVGTSEMAAQELVNKALKVDFFNRNLFDKYGILTSYGIQSRYRKASYKKTNNQLNKQYDLVSSTDNLVSGDDNSVNDTESTQSKEKEIKVNKSNKDKGSKSKKRTYEPDDINFKSAQYLWDKIKSNNPETKEPDLQHWSNDIRLMHERDKRSYEKIKKMTDWCQSDGFWSANILSAKKLRDKYDTMNAQVNRKASKSKPKVIEHITDWEKQAKITDSRSDEEKRRKAKELKERVRKMRAEQP